MSRCRRRRRCHSATPHASAGELCGIRPLRIVAYGFGRESPHVDLVLASTRPSPSVRPLVPCVRCVSVDGDIFFPHFRHGCDLCGDRRRGGFLYFLLTAARCRILRSKSMFLTPTCLATAKSKCSNGCGRSVPPHH